MRWRHESGLAAAAPCVRRQVTGVGRDGNSARDNSAMNALQNGRAWRRARRRRRRTHQIGSAQSCRVCGETAQPLRPREPCEYPPLRSPVRTESSAAAVRPGPDSRLQAGSPEPDQRSFGRLPRGAQRQRSTCHSGWAACQLASALCEWRKQRKGFVDS